MATNTYVALDKVTVGTATPSITFTSIPSTYTDLVIVANCGSASGQAFLMRFNGDTGSNYSEIAMLGNGSSASSYRDANTTFAEIGGIWNSQGISIINIMNYSNTTTYKTALTRNNDASQRAQATVNLWRNTAAITSVTLFPNSSVNFNVGSTFSLYGIAADTGAYTAKATGGTVTSDQFWVYHTFTSSGTFTPLQSLSCEVLVVAGGGAGGASGGSSAGAGGGGAGGYRTASLTLSTPNTVTVGAGGTSPAIEGAASTNGTDSTISTITAAGGGFGGAYNGSIYTNGANGGSGGGASGQNGLTGGTGNTPSTSPSQGNNGGNGTGTNFCAGGGGGAGGAGSNGTGSLGGAGGSGSNAYSSWATATSTGVSGYYAGGGSGGARQGSGTVAGGAGGGGAGAQIGSSQAGNGVANTGGGGGGAGTQSGSGTYNAGGSGGSGIVIVRYAK